MNGPRRLLVAGLAVMLAVLEAKALVGTILIEPRLAVDLEIPLRAAERWLASAPPYLSTAFTSPPGATQPFLYPPYTLPLFAVLTAFPRMGLGLIVVGLLLVVATLTCRRLSVPWIWMPLVLAWPPFAEAIFGANVQVLLFAAFVLLFYRAGGRPWRPRSRDLLDRTEGDGFVAALATSIGAIKVSQLHPWVYAARHRRRAALSGAVAMLTVIGLTLPLTGIGLWFEWVAQLRSAGDPTWDLGGFALARFLPPGVGLVIAGLCVVAAVLVPRGRAPEWLGVLSVVGALSLHIFGLLFLIPAMLRIRAEAALVAAIVIATYSYEGAWAGIAVCAVLLALDRSPTAGDASSGGERTWKSSPTASFTTLTGAADARGD